MAWRPGTPNFTAAAGGNPHLDTALRQIHQRLMLLENKVGLQGIDTTKRAVVSAVPPKARVEVNAPADGQYSIHVTNPEFMNPTHHGNEARTPILHRLEYSTKPDFASDSVLLSPSYQTHFVILDSRPGLYFRVLSSYDGVSWNG